MKRNCCKCKKPFTPQSPYYFMCWGCKYECERINNYDNEAGEMIETNRAGIRA